MNTGKHLQAALQRVLAGLAALSLLACAGGSFVSTPPAASLPALTTATGPYPAQQALASTVTPDLLGMDEPMRAFVDRYVRPGDQRQRLRMLHRSLLSPALVGVQYDPAADGAATEVFHRGAANCLSYAHLFIAMARYAGLDARYLSVSLRPEWQRHGDQVALRRHVSTLVRLRNGEQYVVDIDPVSRERVANTDVLSDREAVALYHSNFAMEELLQQRYRQAYANSLRALNYAPQIDYLWTNLGAVYSRAGELVAAEQAYMTALDLNDNSLSAMNNLAVLFNGQGDQVRSDYWARRVQRHRQDNPYYHYYLGREAEQEGELGEAIAHIRRAVAIKDNDAEFYFRLAKLYQATDQDLLSIRYAEEAIKRSRLVGEREQYQQFLAELSADQVASIGLPGG